VLKMAYWEFLYLAKDDKIYCWKKDPGAGPVLWALLVGAGGSSRGTQSPGLRRGGRQCSAGGKKGHKIG